MLKSLPPRSAALVIEPLLPGTARGGRRALEPGVTEGTLRLTLLPIREALRDCIQERMR